MSEPPAAHSLLEKPPSSAILCTTCGGVCKGEVLRVQSKYFHIQCFVCKGECLPAPHGGAARPGLRLRLRAQGVSGQLARPGGLENPESRIFVGKSGFLMGPASLVGEGRAGGRGLGPRSVLTQQPPSPRAQMQWPWPSDPWGREPEPRGQGGGHDISCGGHRACAGPPPAPPREQ